MTDKIEESNDSAPDDMVLHVVPAQFDPGFHVVSSSTLAEAQAADAAPYLVDFGDLRRHGELDELQQRLESQYEGTLEDYVAAIERSAGRKPASGDLSARLAELADVTFDGLSEDTVEGSNGLYLPADDEDFHTISERENQVAEEYRGYDIISKAMSTDIPGDLFKEFGLASYGDSPVFSGHIDDRVSDGRLGALIAALEARGYIVIQDE